MHSQIAGKSTPRYVSNVGTLLGSSSLPAQCRKRRLGRSVVFRACIGQATCDGEPGNRPNPRATFATGTGLTAQALDPNHFRFAFVA